MEEGEEAKDMLPKEELFPGEGATKSHSPSPSEERGSGGEESKVKQWRRKDGGGRMENIKNTASFL